MLEYVLCIDLLICYAIHSQMGAKSDVFDEGHLEELNSSGQGYISVLLSDDDNIKCQVEFYAPLEPGLCD